MSTVHYHNDEIGIARACWHKCRGLLTSWQFYVGTFATFLPEHLLWDKVPPFSYISHWMGL